MWPILALGVGTLFLYGCYTRTEDAETPAACVDDRGIRGGPTLPNSMQWDGTPVRASELPDTPVRFTASDFSASNCDDTMDDLQIMCGSCLPEDGNANPQEATLNDDGSILVNVSGTGILTCAVTSYRDARTRERPLVQIPYTEACRTPGLNFPLYGFEPIDDNPNTCETTWVEGNRTPPHILSITQGSDQEFTWTIDLASCNPTSLLTLENPTAFDEFLQAGYAYSLEGNTLRLTGRILPLSQGQIPNSDQQITARDEAGNAVIFHVRLPGIEPPQLEDVYFGQYQQDSFTVTPVSGARAYRFTVNYNVRNASGSFEPRTETFTQYVEGDAAVDQPHVLHYTPLYAVVYTIQAEVITSAGVAVEAQEFVASPQPKPFQELVDIGSSFSEDGAIAHRPVGLHLAYRNTITPPSDIDELTVEWIVSGPGGELPAEQQPEPGIDSSFIPREAGVYTYQAIVTASFLPEPVTIEGSFDRAIGDYPAPFFYLREGNFYPAGGSSQTYTFGLSRSIYRALGRDDEHPNAVCSYRILRGEEPVGVPIVRPCDEEISIDWPAVATGEEVYTLEATVTSTVDGYELYSVTTNQLIHVQASGSAASTALFSVATAYEDRHPLFPIRVNARAFEGEGISYSWEIVAINEEEVAPIFLAEETETAVDLIFDEVASYRVRLTVNGTGSVEPPTFEDTITSYPLITVSEMRIVSLAASEDGLIAHRPIQLSLEFSNAELEDPAICPSNVVSWRLSRRNSSGEMEPLAEQPVDGRVTTFTPTASGYYSITATLASEACLPAPIEVVGRFDSIIGEFTPPRIEVEGDFYPHGGDSRTYTLGIFPPEWGRGRLSVEDTFEGGAHLTVRIFRAGEERALLDFDSARDGDWLNPDGTPIPMTVSFDEFDEGERVYTLEARLESDVYSTPARLVETIRVFAGESTAAASFSVATPWSGRFTSPRSIEFVAADNNPDSYYYWEVISRYGDTSYAEPFECTPTGDDNCHRAAYSFTEEGSYDIRLTIRNAADGTLVDQVEQPVIINAFPWPTINLSSEPATLYSNTAATFMLTISRGEDEGTWLEDDTATFTWNIDYVAPGGGWGEVSGCSSTDYPSDGSSRRSELICDRGTLGVHSHRVRWRVDGGSGAYTASGVGFYPVYAPPRE